MHASRNKRMIEEKSWPLSIRIEPPPCSLLQIISLFLLDDCTKRKAWRKSNGYEARSQNLIKKIFLFLIIYITIAPAGFLILLLLLRPVRAFRAVSKSGERAWKHHHRCASATRLTRRPFLIIIISNSDRLFGKKRNHRSHGISSFPLAVGGNLSLRECPRRARSW